MRKFPKQWTKLRERYKKIIPDFDIFLDYLFRPLKTTLRINTLKAEREKILSLISDLNPIPLKWYRDGFITEEEGKIGNHLAHFLGYIYLQEAASMIPIILLSPEQGEKILDLAAAPGSKTTQLAQFMNNRGLIVANDISIKRIKALSSNIDRTGVMNAVVISIDGRRIGKLLPEYFDKILLDAPCSAEGTLRKSREALYRWSENSIKRLSSLQKGLISSAFRCLKKGGVLVYSTCTFAPEENEEVIDFLLKKCDNVQIEESHFKNLKTRPGIDRWRDKKYTKEVEKCIRLYPQDNDTEGFFIAKVRKL